MNVRLGYLAGGSTLNPWFANGGAQKAASDVQALVHGAPDMSAGSWFWLGSGALLTSIMILARSRFLWFPLHPLGYIMSLSYPMHPLRFSIFLGWLAKVVINRFGGNETYRTVTPAFLGLVLGDVSMMLAWLIIDGFTGRVGHELMPG